MAAMEMGSGGSFGFLGNAFEKKKNSQLKTCLLIFFRFLAWDLLEKVKISFLK